MELTKQHFKNTLRYIQSKQRQHAGRGSDEEEGEEGEDGERGKPEDWSAVDVVGGSLKMGMSQ